MTARTTARRLSGFAASRSLTVASVGLPSGLVMVGSPSGVGDVRHHQPAMTACLRRFAEPSARYSWRQTEGLLRSLTTLLDVGVGVPDHTTFSRRSPGLALAMALARAQASGPVH